MKRKQWIAAALAAALVLTLSACGRAATQFYSADEKNAATVPMTPSEPESYNGYSYGAEMPAPSSAPDPSGSEWETGSQLPENVKMIYTAYLQMETTEFDRAASELTSLVNGLGGYFERSGVGSYGSGYRRADYTVRVPAKAFDRFCTEAGNLCKISRIERSAEDVSEAYYDVESRLVTQRTKLERLQALLAKAEEMEDIITLESAISETELQIERLTGSLRKYDSLVSYATIEISLQEVYKVSPDETPAIGFWAKLGAAFRSGTANFVDDAQDLALDFAEGWVGWLIFLAIVVIVILLIRKGVRRRRETSADRAVRRQAKAERKAAKRGGAHPTKWSKAPDTIKSGEESNETNDGTQN